MRRLQKDDHSVCNHLQTLPGQAAYGPDAEDLHASGLPVEGEKGRIMRQSLVAGKTGTIRKTQGVEGVTPRCDLEYVPKPCVEMYRRASMRQGHPCNGCQTGRDRAEAAGPPKEEEVAKLEPKEQVLATITRKQPCVSTPILQCGHVKAAELHQVTNELAAEGKIKIWKDGKKTFYTLPGAPDPFTQGAGKSPAKAKVAPTNDATVASKPPRRVNRRPAAAPVSKPGPRTSIIGAAIADLEGRRDAIDHAIEMLRALA